MAMTDPTAKDQADQCASIARERYLAGDLAEAAQYNRAAWQCDPERGDLWQERLTSIWEAADKLPLAEQTNVRLAAHMITPDDPSLAQIRAWNQQVMDREMGQ